MTERTTDGPLTPERGAPILGGERLPRPPGDREGATSLRVLVVAGYPAVRAGLRTLLAQDGGIDPVEPTALGPDPLGAGDLDLAAIVADLSGMPETAADELNETYVNVPLVLLGADPATDGPGLGAEPVAYLAPDADGPSLAAAVRSVAAGLTVLDPAFIGAAGIHAHARSQPVATTVSGEPLTARERQVLELVAAGLPNKAIARELGISEHTAKFHVTAVLTKLGAQSRADAVIRAARRGMVAL